MAHKYYILGEITQINIFLYVIKSYFDILIYKENYQENNPY